MSYRRIMFILARLSPVLLLPVLSLLLGARFLPILLLPMVMLGPALLFRGDDSGPGGPSSDDGGGGGGSGPRDPETPPRSPFGGLLLPDAQPMRTRLRDHRTAVRMTPGRRRRSTPEPARRPARIPARH